MRSENLKLKRQLIIQSFLPLFVLLFIKYFEIGILVEVKNIVIHIFGGKEGILREIQGCLFSWTFVISLFLVICIIDGLIAIWQFKDMQNSGYEEKGEKIHIEEELTDSSAIFFVTYVVPLLFQDVKSLRDFLVFTGIIALLGILLWRTNLYYQNPVLTILGYRTYKAKVEGAGISENEERIMIANKMLDPSKIIRCKYISDDVFLVYNRLNTTKDKRKQ